MRRTPRIRLARVASAFRPPSVIYLVLVTAMVLGPGLASEAQVTAVIQGRVLDGSGASVPRATIDVRQDSTGFHDSVRTDAEGRYFVGAVPTGTYTLTAEAPGFRIQVAKLTVEVGRTLVRNFILDIRQREETLVVRPDVLLIDPATATVGHVVSAQAIQQIPVNGRHFPDLALLVPGSVAPSQTGFSVRPGRGGGALAINTAGNREEAVGFVLNGVTTNNLTFGSLIFEPPLSSILEFKVDNSAFAAEHGHVSGAIVNIVTRSGTDALSGEMLEFFRNGALDARNFFQLTSTENPRYQRNQFGGSLGGPLIRGRTHYFVAYEGMRQRQGVNVNSLVLSDEQRALVTDPVVRSLIELVPRANFYTADGTARFVGSAAAVVDMDRWTVDLRHNVGRRDRIQTFYGRQRIRNVEPLSQGNSIPGFGQVSHPLRTALILGETHIFGEGLLNEMRFGRVRLVGGTFPATPLNPADFGIQNGVTGPIGLPQMAVAGDLNFGGPGILPQGRYDTSYVLTDTVSRASGRHSVKLGGEYRHFVNENFAEGTGSFNFPSVPAFLAGRANAFTITLGERRSVIDQRAVGLFVQDRVAIADLTLDLGIRYEWHVTPTERDNRFVVFDALTASLVRVGVDVGEVYRQNNQNVEPRAGVAWNVSDDGRTVVRAAYAWAVDQPSTTVVRDTMGNPPFATPLFAAGPVSLAQALEAARPAGLAPATVDPRFRNASLQSWNVNVQRQLAGDPAAMVGYFGSRGRDLRISRNLNQPVNGVRPFPSLSSSSAILPGAPLGNITQVESTGFSSYNALWVSVIKRFSQGLRFDTSYAWSKSLDTNSLNSSGFAVQNGYDIRNEYGLSDFDARHRFVLSASYALPFTSHALTRGWQIDVVVQSQSGNPVNIVTSTSSVNGTPNTVRPDAIAPSRIVGSVDEWFDPAAFVAVDRFGNLGRNTVIGPAFHNTDVSVVKNTTLGGRLGLQLRADIFDLFNHPNFGPPGNIVGSPNFGRITRTRLPTGEAGSSRQIQLGAKLTF